jgi:hypothetical protein
MWSISIEVYLLLSYFLLKWIYLFPLVTPTFPTLIRRLWFLECFPQVFISRNLVICNHSLYDYVWLNVAYSYEWLLMWLFLKIGWILVFFSTSCDYAYFIFPIGWFFIMSLYFLQHHIHI